MPDVAINANKIRIPPNVLSAVFAGRKEAEQAVEALRNLGVGNDAISAVTRHAEEEVAPADGGPEEAERPRLRPGLAALDGAGVGAAVGALFGLASAAIPGVGPFITAGALAQILGVVAGSAVSGAVAGGASGALAGVIAHLGLNEAEARYYAGEVERGGVYLGVDLSRTAMDRETVQGVLDQYGKRLHT